MNPESIDTVPATFAGEPGSGADSEPRMVLTVLAHPDPRRIGDRTDWSESVSDPVEISRLGPKFSESTSEEGAPLEDAQVSRTSWRIASVGGVLAIERGALATSLRVNGQEVDDVVAVSEEMLRRGVVIGVAYRVALFLRRARVLEFEEPDGTLVGRSPEMVELKREIAALADLGDTVLIRGETGTGKELVAKALHRWSRRRDEPFKAINMGGLGAELAASELFGVRAGAFTGAKARGGLLVEAGRGTVFLDEIGEAPLEVQVTLLRALDDKTVRPMGSDSEIGVAARVVAATDADLESARADGRFRDPLFHRLSRHVVNVPPLRGRLDDLGRLVRHILEDKREAGDRLPIAGEHDEAFIPAPLMESLALYDWPGNVRELENVVHRLEAARRGGATLRLTPSLADLLSGSAPADSSSVPSIRLGRESRHSSAIGDDELRVALREEQWNVHRTAERLGISRSALYRRIDQMPGIRKAADLGGEEIEAALAAAGGDVHAAAEALEVSPRGLQLRIRVLKKGS